LIDGVVHRAIIVKDSSDIKEHFPKAIGHAQPMADKKLLGEELPLAVVVAQNLAELMIEKKLKQVALAEKAGVSQKTISNFLSPTQRTGSSSGKAPSGTLTNLEKIARALDVRPWLLTRPSDAMYRQLVDLAEQAYEKARPPQESKAQPAPPPTETPTPTPAQRRQTQRGLVPAKRAANSVRKRRG
jgi:transcriptional regulator with XRE-family HTH domain